MLSYTISMMCMNNIKYNIKHTNILCRALLCIILTFSVFEVCDLCLLTSYSVLITTSREIINLC